MKKLQELRYPTEEELKRALEASKKGPDAVLEFLRKGRAEKVDSSNASGEERPGKA